MEAHKTFNLDIRCLKKLTSENPLLRYHRLMEDGVSNNATLNLIDPKFGPMTIFVRCLLWQEPFIPLETKYESTVGVVKQMIYEAKGIPSDILRLTYIRFGGMIFFNLKKK